MKRILLILLVVVITLFTSCQQKNDNSKEKEGLPVTQAETTLQQHADQPASVEPAGPDEEWAMGIVSELLFVQLTEGRSIVSKGEGEVNGQHAFLFDLGQSTSEKFTAEEHYAVTDDGNVWQLDIIANEWNAAVPG